MNPKTQEYWIKRKQAEWQEVKSMGTRFETEDSSGFIYKGKKHYDWKRGPVITGINFPWPDLPYVKSENPWKTKER